MAPRSPRANQSSPPRFSLMDISPVVECGQYPAVGVYGEVIPFGVTAFREGHEPLNAEIHFTDPTGDVWGPFPMQSGDDPDRFEMLFQPHTEGTWSYTITAWANPWENWTRRACIKIPAGLDIDVELVEGAAILQSIATDTQLSLEQSEEINAAVVTLRDTSMPALVRLGAVVDSGILRITQQHPIRQSPTSSGPWPLLIERTRALVGAWYEFFPRSEGASLAAARSGTFASASKRLPHIAAMGFDVVYLPPIHPIGTIHRKGRNDSLTPEKSDPGSPWAIGSDQGGHDCIHPDLGNLSDFKEFVTSARAEGLEIALDLALQAAPDHPWVRAHPEWFTTRADGSIAYAENPPKKYQDIYPLNFDKDPEGLFAEVERIVRFWIDLGVDIFRVDNPHTKPLWVWQRLIHSINASHPGVIFLAEAFTRAPMMRALAEQGFQQSYTYFTWKTSKKDLEEYFRELAGPMSAYMRPNVFTNTPDILHEYLQSGIPAAFAIRATLAATLSPTFGIYSGFELYEHVSLFPGSEEYLDSEKFQYRPRDWDLAQKQGRTMAPYLTQLNFIRRNNAALQSLRSLRFHATDSPEIMAYSKQDHDNIVLVVCSLDPDHEQSTIVHWNMPLLGLEWDSEFSVHDELTMSNYRWDQHTFVRFNPSENVAHIARICSSTNSPVVFSQPKPSGPRA